MHHMGCPIKKQTLECHFSSYSADMIHKDNFIPIIYFHKSSIGNKNRTKTVLLNKKLYANLKNDILTRHRHSKARLNRTGLDVHAVNLFSEYKIKW